MKKLIILLFLFLVGKELMAQNRYGYPPQNVRDAYSHDFPNADRPNWVFLNGQWRAHFIERGPDQLGEMDAYYDRDGHRIDYHIPYNREDVPPAVIDRHREIFKDGKIIGYNRIIGPDDHAVFEIQFNHKGRTRSAYYDEDGHDRQYDDHHDGYRH